MRTDISGIRCGNSAFPRHTVATERGKARALNDSSHTCRWPAKVGSGRSREVRPAVRGVNGATLAQVPGLGGAAVGQWADRRVTGGGSQRHSGRRPRVTQFSPKRTALRRGLLRSDCDLSERTRKCSVAGQLLLTAIVSFASVHPQANFTRAGRSRCHAQQHTSFQSQ